MVTIVACTSLRRRVLLLRHEQNPLSDTAEYYHLSSCLGSDVLTHS